MRKCFISTRACIIGNGTPNDKQDTTLKVHMGGGYMVLTSFRLDSDSHLCLDTPNSLSLTRSHLSGRLQTLQFSVAMTQSRCSSRRGRLSMLLIHCIALVEIRSLNMAMQLSGSPSLHMLSSRLSISSDLWSAQSALQSI